MTRIKNMTLAKAVISLGLVVGFLHFSALSFYLYWTFRWFDIVMHLLGGILVGLFALWAYRTYIQDYKKVHNALLLFDVILFTFLVSIFWEIFEYAFFFTEQSLVSWTYDTLLDLIMNFVGALIAVFLVRKQHFFVK